MSNPFLSVKELSVHYSGIAAVKRISFELSRGQLVALIGSNGAGKTTTLSALAGVLPFAQGQVQFLGQSILGRGAWDIVKMGLAMVPEGRGVFTRMSIDENLLMGAYLRDDHEGIQADLDEVFSTFPRLYERRTQLAGTLSGGEQQMLAIGRALMSKPTLLLLDEPSMGLAPIMVDRIFEVIQSISQKGVSILLVEQNAYRALEVADYAYILESGSIAFSGPGKELLKDDRVQSTYLGN
jgi:branched-chain amino acid transport system ATP-binding protein